MSKIVTLIVTLMLAFACQGGCNISEVADKASEYKDKIDPNKAKEAVDKAKEQIK